MKISTDPSTIPKLDKPLEVLVIGGGWGGLTAALAFRRRACTVTVLEAATTFKSLGGLLGLTPNGTRLLDRYSPGFLSDMYAGAIQTEYSHFRHSSDGHIITSQKLDISDKVGYKILMGSRSEFHEIFLKHAVKAGVDVVFNSRVQEFGDVEGERPWVITGEGRRFEADLIVCFDGVKSRARDYILGRPSPPIPSGFSVYRGYVPGKLLADDPVTKPLVEGGDSASFWLGDNQHFGAHTWHGGDDWFWVLMRPDSVKQAEEESYSAQGNVKDVLELLKDWDPKINAAVAKSTQCLDWKICMRPDIPSWVSKGGRIILGGDAAHPMPPTAGQGATQSIEDGAVYAYSVLKLPTNIPLALRIAERLRTPRIIEALKIGESQRNAWHKKDETGDKYTEKNIQIQFAKFFTFDAEQDTEDRWESVMEEILREDGRKGV